MDLINLINLSDLMNSFMPFFINSQTLMNNLQYMRPTLFLIPVPIAEISPDIVLPAEVNRILKDLKYFVVENPKTSMKFLRKTGLNLDFEQITFLTLNEHTSPEEISGLITPMRNGNNMGLMSEAGMPALADPGAELVDIAHRAGFRIKPLAGPSSITLALIASGLNGQNFAFNGYLPVKKDARINAIKKLEEKLYREKQTQIFMETPYRNMALMSDLLTCCRPATRLCIAADITGENEFIVTRSIGTWKKNIPDIHKKPAVFIIGIP
jgi:16S rRNA (cytidine1402-2'-O)-methyltransferase